jgi:hypothetical protein
MAKSDPENILQQAMAKASEEAVAAGAEATRAEATEPAIDQQAESAVAKALNAVAETGTEVPPYRLHSHHVAALNELQARHINDQIYEIDRKLADLLAERADLVTAFRIASGTQE